jgi:ribosomal protein S18 acetylase RimI-like enzyme
MGFELRQLGSDDAVALVELLESVLPGFSNRPGFDISDPAGFLRDPASFVFAAYSGGAPAGLAWGIQMRCPNGEFVTYLHELDVREEYRRLGVATSLVESSMALARQRGSSKFWLTTGGHNMRAQALYDSLAGVRKPLGDVSYWWDLE